MYLFKCPCLRKNQVCVSGESSNEVALRVRESDTTAMAVGLCMYVKSNLNSKIRDNLVNLIELLFISILTFV